MHESQKKTLHTDDVTQRRHELFASIASFSFFHAFYFNIYAAKQ